jgi:DNA-binding transcriptional MerR regulator
LKGVSVNLYTPTNAGTIFECIPSTMKKPLPQIAFDFVAGDEQQNNPEGTGGYNAGVGVRIKSLKKGAPAAEARTVAVPESRPAKSTRGRKSLKQTSAEADLVEIPGDDILFSKQYYSMGEVAEMFRVNQSLLRFWEAEFDILKPRKNKKGDRYFRPVDIKNLHLIYHLLRQRKYTIEGAKDFLKKNKKAEERFEAIQHLQNIRAFLLEWKAQL